MRGTKRTEKRKENFFEKSKKKRGRKNELTGSIITVIPLIIIDDIGGVRVISFRGLTSEVIGNFVADYTFVTRDPVKGDVVNFFKSGKSVAYRARKTSSYFWFVIA